MEMRSPSPISRVARVASKVRKPQSVGLSLCVVALLLGSALLAMVVLPVPTHAQPCDTTITTENGSNNVIQTAIDAATSEQVICVHGPGTYPEQLTITTSVTLEGVGTPTILAPSTLSPDVFGLLDIVTATGGATVTISGFTISGPYTGIDYGIFVGGGATATIEDNSIVSIRDNPLSGDENGGGIRVGSSALSTSGTATIESNVISDYQKGGIVVDGSGSSATVEYNTVTGVGATPTIAQNGIQISRGATGTVYDNTVSGNVCTDPTQCGPAGPSGGSTGILIFQSGGVTVSTNTLTGNDYGIYTAEDTSPVPVESNTISDSTYYGIVIEYEGVSVLVSGNSVTSTLCADIPAGVDWGGYTCGPDVVTQVQGLGIGVWDDTGSTSVTGNTLSFNDIGVLLASDTGTDTVMSNAISWSTYAGLVVYDESASVSGNTYSSNLVNSQDLIDTSCAPSCLLTTSATGGVTSDQSGTTGVSVVITGSSSDDTPVQIQTEVLQYPTSCVGSPDLGNPECFDVQVTPITDGTATICVNDALADASTIMLYWNGASWAFASDAASTSGVKVCGDIPVSTLYGNDVIAGDPPLTTTTETSFTTITTTATTPTTTTETSTMTATTSTTTTETQLTTVISSATATETSTLTTTSRVTSTVTGPTTRITTYLTTYTAPTTITTTKATTYTTSYTTTSAFPTTITSTITIPVGTTTSTMVQIITVSCNHASVVVGATITCKATVISFGPPPTGRVAWSSSNSGTFSSATCTLTRHPRVWTSSTCIVKFTPTVVGFSSLVALYQGDSRNSPSATTYSLTATMKATKTTASCTPRSAVAGSSTVITCTAKVTGYSPTGTVTWSQSGTGSVSLTSEGCTLTIITHNTWGCSVTMVGSTSGHVTMTATYAGDPNNQGSSRTAKLTIKA